MSEPTLLLSDLSLASEQATKNRIIVAVDGLDKHGKTNFALSAPKPMVYLDFDVGKEGVVEKAPGRKYICVTKPFVFLPSQVAWEVDDDTARTKKVMAAAEPELTRFRKIYFEALEKHVMLIGGKKHKARSIVIDTGSEAWALLRLCEFGKLTKVMPHHYTEVNGFMRDLVRAAFDADVNVIWLHKLKAEWKDNAEGKGRKTGVLERDGFDGMSYLVQANLLAYRVPANQVDTTNVKWKSGEGLYEVPLDPRDGDDMGFRLVVGNSRHNPSLEGLILQNDQITFPTIAKMMLPESSDEDWEDSVS